MRIILLGPPGVGKGTQAPLISKRMQIPWISTGDMLREAVHSGTEVGRSVEDYVARGDLVPDDVVIQCVEMKLSEPDAAEGFLLDGFPRTVPQAEALDELLRRRGDTLSKVIYLGAPAELVVRRIGGRLTCANCHAVYNVEQNPPKRPGICDSCGGVIALREDDQPAAVRHRMQVYEEKTAPLVDYYKEKSLLREVDAEGEPEAVYKRIQAALQT